MTLSPFPASRPHIKWLMAGAFVALAAAPVPAQTITSTWTGASGNWTSPALWTPAVPNNGSPPGATYNAVVDGPGTLTVDTNITIQQLTFPLPNGAINVQAGTLRFNDRAAGIGALGSTGPFTVAAGATLEFAGPSNRVGSVTGAGTIRFSTTTLGLYNVTGATEVSGSAAFNNGGSTGSLLLESFGSLFVRPGTLTVNGPMTLRGSNSLGSFNNEGAFVVNGGATIVNGLGLTQTQLTLNGGTSVWSNGLISSSAGARLTNAAGSTLLITGDGGIGSGSPGGLPFTIENAGLIRKQGGTGTTQFGQNAVVTNTGTIEVLSGTLLVFSVPNPGFSRLTNFGTITVGPGAALAGTYTHREGGVLRGSGTIQASSPHNFLNGSALAPGVDGPGVLTTSSPVGMASGSTFLADLRGTAPGTGYDRLDLGTTGMISLGAALVTSLGYAPAPGDALAIIQGSGTTAQVTGAFANAPPGSPFLIGAFNGQLYAATASYTPNAVILSNFVPVPEPAHVLLACGAAAGALGWWRRRAAGRGLAALAVFALAASPASAQVITSTWTGASGNWTSPALWTPVVPRNGFPNSTDRYNAVINGSNTLTVDTPITIDGLSASGATIEVPSSGLLTVNGPANMSGIRFTGGSTTTDSVVLNGGGTINGSSGGMILGSSINVFRLTLNGGTTVWSGGDIGMTPASTLSNAAGSTLLITGNNSLAMGTPSSASIVENAGIIRKQGGTGTTRLLVGRIVFRNTGTIEVLSGTLDVTSPIVGVVPAFSLMNQGTITVGPGTTLLGPVVNASGSVLRGTGTVATMIAPPPTRFLDGSTLSPGIGGPGTFTITSPITMSPGSTFAVDLNGNAPGTGYDRLSLETAGTIDLGGATLATLLGYAPVPGDVLTIIQGNGTMTQVTGTFANAVPGSQIYVGTFGGQNYGATVTYSPNAVSLSGFQVIGVPEPSSLALAALAAAGGAAGWVRRKHKRGSPGASAEPEA